MPTERLLNYLDGPEREAFSKEVNDQCLQLKKWGGGGTKQIASIDRILGDASQSRLTNGTNTRPTVTTTTPSSPGGSGLQGDTTSTGPTPSLTTEQSSPQSISPPSTDADNVEDSVTEKAGPSVHDQPNPIAQVSDA